MKTDLFGTFKVAEAHCSHCGSVFDRNAHDYTYARLYCSGSCAAKAYRRRTKEKVEVEGGKLELEYRLTIPQIRATLNDLFGIYNKPIKAFIDDGPRKRGGKSGIVKSPRGAPMLFLNMSLEKDTDECIDWPFNRKPDGYARITYSEEYGTPLVCRVYVNEFMGQRRVWSIKRLIVVIADNLDV